MSWRTRPDPAYPWELMTYPEPNDPSPGWIWHVIAWGAILTFLWWAYGDGVMALLK